MTDPTPARGFDSLAVHAGQAFDPTTGAVIPPVHFSTTYAQDGIGGLRSGYEYGRSGNPTRTALETQLAALEGGEHGLSFSSGLAAEDALLRAVLKPGDDVLLGNDVYGGTYRLIARILGPWGIGLRVVDMSDLDAVAAALERAAGAHPVGRDPEQPAAADHRHRGPGELGHEAGALVVVDNTFASPALQQPLAPRRRRRRALDHEVPRRALRRGRRRARDQRRRGRREARSSCSSRSAPCRARWTRGSRRAASRRSASACSGTARTPRRSPPSSRATTGSRGCYYPGLAVAPRSRARRAPDVGVRRDGLGRARRTRPTARRFAESTRLFQLAESLGGVESLMNYPDEMTHASVRGTELAVPEDVVRLSVGIESVDDLLADVEQALDGL